MSFFKRIAASMGVGGAEVDTVLDKSTFCPGDLITGTIHVRGGSVKQDIDDIDLYVMTRYIMEKDDQRIYQESKITTFRAVNRFTILPREEKSFPFQFRLPLDTPISLGSCMVWIKTNLDIKHGLDAQDNDQIQVRPHPWIDKILNAVSDCGFRLREADCEYAPYFRRRLPFVQEFEFVPNTRKYQNKLDEIELVFHLEENGLEVALEVDRKARGVSGWLEEQLNLDETLVRVRLSRDDLNQNEKELAKKFDELISQHANRRF
ncbi:sporulation protein [Thermoflavimicrobium dichotomicum]|uniref:Sporulation-control protein n=1 Tax=Thermoflavimicrobium dichotomicum TaxID=46223 RepID=A0A1I3NMH8_9BACL|nr:sporulation protein [Thermoflavimicrobium dichotomicum]SFJ10504.1 sporulation-control protein [Thermoflavimicrobium dichotomicum]